MRNHDIVFNNRLAGQVARYHTWPTIRQQSVGEHTWQVMRIYRELFDPMPPAEVWGAVHDHDKPEIRTGDLPFSAEQPGDEWDALKVAAKKLELRVRDIMGIPEYTLTSTELARVKVADLLECWEFGLAESRLGSRYGRVVMSNVLPAVDRLWPKTGTDPECLRRWLDGHGSDAQVDYFTMEVFSGQISDAE